VDLGPAARDVVEALAPPRDHAEDEALALHRIAREHGAHGAQGRGGPHAIERAADVGRAGVDEHEPREIARMIRAPRHRHHAAERHREQAPRAGVRGAKLEEAGAHVERDLAHRERAGAFDLGAGARQIEEVDARVRQRGAEDVGEAAPVALLAREASEKEPVHRGQDNRHGRAAL
jgi:hypothetical protein